MKKIGLILMWGGFFPAAFFATRESSAVPWPPFLVCALLGVAGVVVLRVSARQARGHPELIGAQSDTLRSSIERILQRLRALMADKEAIDVYDVHGRIDRELAADLADFADARESLITVYGLDPYARIMTEFAGAERMINRAWSASADGYVDEVWLSLERALGQMEQAQSLLDSYRSQGASVG